MNTTADSMKFISFIKPVLTAGAHNVTVTQSVSAPEADIFNQSETFYVATRAYTIDPSTVFSVAPSENECGDLSKLLPFITIENKSFPWERKIADDIADTPVPWVALIVISSTENAVESDIAIADIEKNTSSVFSKLYCPAKTTQAVLEAQTDMCHVVDIPRALFSEIMPTHEDMVCLTHARRVNLSNTDDGTIEKSGDFSVVMANRFVPTGVSEPLKSTVHLVSMLNVPQTIPGGYHAIRLISLHRFNVYSQKDDSETFQLLIDQLRANTGIVGFDKKDNMGKRGYALKKHLTRSGETTYSFYRPPLIPYKSVKTIGAKYTADGYLIYDPQIGIFDASYAAAFQLGRIITLSRKTDAKLIDTWRKSAKVKSHRKNLRKNVNIDAYALCKRMTERTRE